MSRNRNNSMHPMPNIRDNYYNNGPTPAVFNQDNNNCIFENNNYKKATSDNTVNYDNSINSIQQMNFRQNEYKNSRLIDNNVNSTPKEDITKEITLVVDSMDRDIDTYPNSFDFKVIFNPNSSNKQPYINKKLENIKSVKLQAIILPNYYKLEKTAVNTGSTTLDNDIVTILANSTTPNTDNEFNSSSNPSIPNGNSLIIIWYEQTGSLVNNLLGRINTTTTTLNNGTYSNLTVSGGSGSGAILTLTVLGFIITTVTVTTPGDGYKAGDTIKIANLQLSGSDSDVIFKLTPNNITPTVMTIDFFDTADALKHEKVYSIVFNGGYTVANISSFNYYTYKTTNPIKISDDRFIYMEIDELKGIDDYSTDVYRGHSFGTLYHDATYCNSNICYMNSIFSNIQFPNSNLKNLSSLSIKLYSSVGEELNSSINKNTNITNKTKINEYSGDSIKYVSASRYIRHPLYLHNQCHFVFKIKYIEPSINKINFN